MEADFGAWYLREGARSVSLGAGEGAKGVRGLPEQLACFSARWTGAAICGAAAGRLWVVETEEDVPKVFEMVRSNTLEQATAPVNQVELLDDEKGMCVLFSLWEGEFLCFAALEQNAKVRAMRPTKKGVGHLECFALDEKSGRVILGTSCGFVFLFRLDTLEVLFSSDGSGSRSVSASCFLPSCDDDFACGYSDGRVRVFRSVNEDGETVSMFRPESSRVQCLRSFACGSQNLIVTGLEDGCVFVWEQTGSRFKRLASLGNFSEDAIHSVAVVRNSSEGIVVIIGDDAGHVWFFGSPESNRKRPLKQEPWRPLKKLDMQSPVVAVTVVSETEMYVACCESGVRTVNLTSIEESIDVILPKESSGFDSCQGDDKVPEIQPPPEPLPMPQFCSFDREENAPTEAQEEEEEEALETPEPFEYPEFSVDGFQAVCYDGFLDEDRPPLPLSEYHEPAVHSSALLRQKIENLQTARFEDNLDKREDDDDENESNDSSEKKALKRIATRVLTVKANERVYQGLTQLPAAAPLPNVSSFRARKARAQVSKKFRRKTIAERQEEEIEKHRARYRKLREGKEEEENEDCSPKRETRIKSLQGEGKENDSPSKSSVSSWNFPWAKEEFYLSKAEDGRVGFHNFRSLLA